MQPAPWANDQPRPRCPVCKDPFEVATLEGDAPGGWMAWLAPEVDEDRTAASRANGGEVLIRDGAEIIEPVATCHPIRGVRMRVGDRSVVAGIIRSFRPALLRSKRNGRKAGDRRPQSVRAPIEPEQAPSALGRSQIALTLRRRDATPAYRTGYPEAHVTRSPRANDKVCCPERSLRREFARPRLTRLWPCCHSVREDGRSCGPWSRDKRGSGRSLRL